MENLSILIADDHRIFREGLEKLLSRKSYVNEIRHASNGKEAIAAMEIKPADIIFMDVRMPQMDGIQATQKLSAKFPLVKIIALTMMEDRKSIVQMFKAGVNGYLLKSTNFKEIEYALTEVMSGKKYYSKEVSEIIISKTISRGYGISLGPHKKNLTDREQEVVLLLCQGFKNGEIAEMLSISEKTVENHRARIYQRLEIDNLADLIFYAIEHHIIRKVE